MTRLPPLRPAFFTRTVPGAALACAALVLAITARRAAADGVPLSGMVYSGYLEDAAGTPANGSLPMVVTVFDAETAGVALCTTAATAAVARGRFSLPLDVACNTSVQNGPDRWVELTVEGAPLPRQRIGAVPYAREAGRASDASGALKATLAGLAADSAKIASASAKASEAKSAADAAASTAGAAKGLADGAAANAGQARVTANQAAVRLSTIQFFEKTGNNGSVSCDDYCHGAQWGQQGACVAAKALNTTAHIPCSIALGGFGPAQCFCATF